MGWTVSKTSSELLNDAVICHDDAASVVDEWMNEWMSTVQWWKTPFQCHFIQNKANTAWPGVETGPQRLETSEWPPWVDETQSLNNLQLKLSSATQRRSALLEKLVVVQLVLQFITTPSLTSAFETPHRITAGLKERRISSISAYTCCTCQQKRPLDSRDAWPYSCQFIDRYRLPHNSGP
jgi:hypothetical protein